MISFVGGVRNNRSEENGTFGLVCYAAADQAANIDALAAANGLERNFYGPVQRRTPEKKEEKEKEKEVERESEVQVAKEE